MTDTQQLLKDVLIANCKPDSLQNSGRYVKFTPYLIRNKTTPYNNTDEDKDRLLEELYTKCSQANNSSNTLNTTGRNLIYFSVFLNEEYITLIELLLQSILDNTSSVNFDLLFITDEFYKNRLLEKTILNKFNCYFHLVPTPISGVRASIHKLSVYDYPGINNYQKILYLDCDIVCINDIKEVFNLTVSSNKLYTGTTSKITANAVTTFTHGILYLTNRDIETIIDNYKNIAPFNAGQFSFCNTPQMRAHFDNVRWLIENWPGDMFFEQGPMNYYFVINKLNQTLIVANGDPAFGITASGPFTNGRKVKIAPPIVTGATSTACLSSEIDFIKQHAEEMFCSNLGKKTCTVHFAGTPLAGEKKIQKIKQFLDARKL